MKKTISKLWTFACLVLSMTLIHQAISAQPTINQTDNSAFLAQQDHKLIMATGNYHERRAPFSTFKIPLALMAFDAGIFTNKDTPTFQFRDEYEANFQSWYTRQRGEEYHWIQDQTPFTFMKNSVLWVSHIITKELGKEKFQGYLEKLNYGNKDVSGTPDKDDGLINGWLGTSLKISPAEQLEFLQKLCANKLDISKEAQEKTRQVMDREEDWNGWKLYGKTGGGNGRNGWFVGWIEKNGQKILFAQYLDLEDPHLDLKGITVQKSVGLTAKDLIKEKLRPYWQKQ